MKTKLTVFLAIILLSSIYGGNLSSASTMDVNVGITPGQSINKVINILETKYGAKEVQCNARHHFATLSIERELFDRIRSDGELKPLISYVEEDYVITIPEIEQYLGMMVHKAVSDAIGFITPASPGMDVVPNDPKYNLQWGPRCVDAEDAWKYMVPNDQIIVAIIDTGIDLSHEDLVHMVDTNIDKDFVQKDDEADDDMGHGTHVAGIVSAELNNAIGIAGLAQIKLMAVKAVNFMGMGNMSTVANAIYYAADNGAHVINLSLGTPTPTATLENAVNYAYYQKDVVVIAAAGNSSNTVKQYPAAYDAVIGVSSLDPDCVKKSSFSSYGTANVELAAPGANIYSTLPDHKTFWNSLGLFPYDYGYLDGTSMACPHVVGAAAAYRAYRPDISAQTTRGALRKFADNLGNQEYFGYGRVDMDPYTD